LDDKAEASEDVEVASGFTCFKVAEIADAKDKLGFEAAVRDERGAFAQVGLEDDFVIASEDVF
jgi:hypothetical protein